MNFGVFLKEIVIHFLRHTIDLCSKMVKIAVFVLDIYFSPRSNSEISEKETDLCHRKKQMQFVSDSFFGKISGFFSVNCIDGINFSSASICYLFSKPIYAS